MTTSSEVYKIIRSSHIVYSEPMHTLTLPLVVDIHLYLHPSVLHENII